jgi:hypothetical protein
MGNMISYLRIILTTGITRIQYCLTSQVVGSGRLWMKHPTDTHTWGIDENGAMVE